MYYVIFLFICVMKREKKKLHVEGRRVSQMGIRERLVAEWVDGWMGGRRNGWMGGFAKVDNGFG